MNRRQPHHRLTRLGRVLVVLAQAPIPPQPGERPFHHPTHLQGLKARHAFRPAHHHQAVRPPVQPQPGVQSIVVILVIREHHPENLFQKAVAARFQRAESSNKAIHRHVRNVPPHPSGTDSERPLRSALPAWRSSHAELDHRLFAAAPLPRHPGRRWPSRRSACCSLRYLDIDAFPDTTPVQVQINTVAPALGPEEVEQQITFPVEQALSGLPRLRAAALGLEVRPVAGRRHLRGRHRHLLRPPARQRAAGHRASCPTGIDRAQDGAGRHRPGRGLSLHRHRQGRRR